MKLKFVYFWTTKIELLSQYEISTLQVLQICFGLFERVNVLVM